MAGSTKTLRSAGFLHVLQGSSVTTYAIDAATGQLRPSATQDVGDAHTLTGEPQGRYVFAAFGPRGGPPYFDPSIVTYAPDPASGSLRKVSEASSDPIWCRCCNPWGRSGGWYWLSASAARVYGMFYTGTYHDVYHAYVTHAMGTDGHLAPAYVQMFDEADWDQVTVDIGSNVFYKQTLTGGVSAHLVRPDGQLVRMGASRLCLASALEYAKPLVAVAGFLFASADIEEDFYGDFVCSWEGPRLAPRAKLPLNHPEYAVALAPVDGSSAATSSAASPPPTLVAMRTWYSVKRGTAYYHTTWEVRLFAMGEHGDLELLDTVEPGFAWEGLFHPSGRFLYVSRAADMDTELPPKMVVYSIDPQGHLEVVETVEDGGGVMAVTLPPEVRASTGPAMD
jgi:hypothetical protein